MLAALSSLSLVLASLSLVTAAPHEQGHGLVKKSHHNVAAHLQKRFSGRATWYDVGQSGLRITLCWLPFSPTLNP